eukprot:scaffold62112_cov35-Phaeocystis_antarctica.AAC.4
MPPRLSVERSGGATCTLYWYNVAHVRHILRVLLHGAVGAVHALTLFLGRETAITQKRPYHASRQM